MADVEQDFHLAMLDIHKAAKMIGYKATYFKRMVDEMGGLRAAKKLLLPGKIHDGFLKLLELDALDISVEALILDPRWPKDMFSEMERREARKRLGR